MSTTWTPGPDDELDLADLAATDAWLDAVASRTGGADPLAAQLIGWLDRIDDEHESVPAVEIAAAAADVAPVVDLRSASGASRRMPRRALAAVAILSVTTLAGVGVAAASPGTPLYPVHRVVFGAADQQALDRASRLLDQSAAIITPAQASGQISASQRAAATRLLGQAAGLLDHAAASSHRATLERRLQGLTASLAALVTPAPTPAVIVPSVHATPVPTPGSGSGKGSGHHDTSGNSGNSGNQSGNSRASSRGLTTSRVPATTRPARRAQGPVTTRRPATRPGTRPGTARASRATVRATARETGPATVRVQVTRAISPGPATGPVAARATGRRLRRRLRWRLGRRLSADVTRRGDHGRARKGAQTCSRPRGPDAMPVLVYAEVVEGQQACGVTATEPQQAGQVGVVVPGAHQQEVRTPASDLDSPEVAR